MQREMFCDNIYVQLSCTIIILLLSVVLVPIYLIVGVLPSLLILCILRAICCGACLQLPSLFDLYLHAVFWPYTAWLCWVKLPYRRCKRGNKVLYLGEIQRQTERNNYHEIRTNMRLLDVDELNQLYSHKQKSNMVRIVSISDTHGRHHWLTSLIASVDADILIHCGDITFQGKGGLNALRDFDSWMQQFRHKYKIIIGGNHDRFMPEMDYLLLKESVFRNCHYLDNKTLVMPEYQNLSVFGCAWSPNGSANNAFQDINDQMLNMNDSQIDILLGHSDLTDLLRYNAHSKQAQNVLNGIKSSNACIHLCGHFHARYGAKVKTNFYSDSGDMLVVNCSSLDGLYIPNHAPVVFDIQL